MPYSCEDIKYYLEHDEIYPANESKFLNHLENCPRCQAAVKLDPELEEILAVSIPRTSPLTFSGDILPEIYKIEQGLARQSRMEKIALPVFALLAFIPVALAAWLWEDIRTLPGSLNSSGAYNKLVSFISGIDLPEINVTEVSAFISDTPLITLMLISITALIWAFSINEAQKALK